MGVGVAVVPAAAGPYLVKDIATGSDENRGPNSIWFLPGTQSGFFAADTPGYGDALWITDGTEAGTRLVRDIVPDMATMGPVPVLWESGGQIYVGNTEAPLSMEAGGIAYLEINGGLWKSDGTYAGTEPIASVDVLAMTEFLGALYFVAEEPERGTLLFRSDGTREGTESLAILPDGGTSRPTVTLMPGDSTLWILTSRYSNSPYLSQVRNEDAAYTNPPLVWKSDGTGPGTIPVPIFSTLVQPALLVDDLLYFQWNDSPRRYELWRSDGTDVGTRVVRSAQAAEGFYRVLDSVVGNGTLYFLVADPDMEIALWKSDGTPEGTVQVYPGWIPPTPAPVDATPTPVSLPPYDGRQSRFSGPGYEMVVLGSTVVYSADDGTTGTGLWSSDGTTAGTRLVAKGWSNSRSRYPSHLTAANGRVFFAAVNDRNRSALWVTDGTPEGTRSLFPPASDSSEYPYPYLFSKELAPSRDGVYFQPSDGIHGAELWKSDGTPEGTRMVKDLVPPTNGWSGPLDFVEVNNTLLFTAKTSDEGREFWRTDGTTEGTQLVRDIRPGSGNPLIHSGPLVFPVWNSLLFLAETDPIEPFLRLWRTDGTTAGTRPLVLFPLLDGSAYDYYYGQLDFWPPSPSNRDPLLFALRDYRETPTVSPPGEEPSFAIESQDALYRSDGTPTGNYPLKTGWTEYLGPAGDTTIFLSDPAYYDRRTTDGMVMSPATSLWATNGRIEGTALLAELPAGEVEVDALTAVGGLLYLSIAYSRIDTDNGYEWHHPYGSVWRTDGTADGTYPLLDDLEDVALNYHLTGYFGIANGRPVFSTYEYDSSLITLWSTDGSREGMVPLYSSPRQFTPLGTIGGRILFATPFFTSTNRYDGATLLSTDGTAEGTVIVRELPPPRVGYYNYSSEYEPVLVGNRIVFFWKDAGDAPILWSTDGTADGTFPIQSLTPIFGYPYESRGGYYNTYESISEIAGEVLGGNRFVFAADDGVHGAELWATDGTTTGTRLLRDILPGPLDSGIAIVDADDERIFFSANDGTTGYELWMTDGTPLGTVRLTDLNPGLAGFSPLGTHLHNNTFYFGADDGSGIGDELWALPLADLPLPTQIERDILPRILNQPGAPAVDDQNADVSLDIADFIRARGER